MELSCLCQTSGSQGREPWVNFTLLPPTMRARERERERPSPSVQQYVVHPICYYFMNIVNVTVLCF